MTIQPFSRNRNALPAGRDIALTFCQDRQVSPETIPTKATFMTLRSMLIAFGVASSVPLSSCDRNGSALTKTGADQNWGSFGTRAPSIKWALFAAPR